MQMVTVGLLVRLEAKAGKEAEVGDFLRSALPLVQEETATTAWFALQMGPQSFAIFDAFPDDEGRDAHLAGRVAAGLLARAEELLSTAPSIERVDILESKLTSV